MKKRVAIFLYSLGAGGAERIAAALLETFQDKFELHLVLMEDIVFYKLPETVDLHILGKSRIGENGILKLLKLPFLAYQYKRYCKNHGIDVSLSFMNRPNYINILAKLFGNRSKTVISERGTPSMYYKNDLQGHVSKTLIKKLYPYADVVIANSQGNTLDLTRNFQLKDVITIYNFIEERVCIKEEKSNFVFITIGRMDEDKNHKLLISAFEEGNFDAELWLIGDGPLRREWEENSSPKVKFLGVQDNVFYYLNQADCFVFGSNNEGFPNVLLEAMVCGLPIISTDCKSGPREILAPDTDLSTELKNGIEFAQYGILTPVNDVSLMQKAMSIMMQDARKRENYAKKAKIRSKYFKKNKNLSKYLEVIDG